MTGKSGRRAHCEVCDKSIPKSVYKITCASCKGWHHLGCVNLSEFEARIMSEQNKSWTCEGCRGQAASSGLHNLTLSGSPGTGKSVGSDTALTALVVELKAEIGGLRSEVSTMKQSLEFFNSLYEEQRKANKVMGEMMEEVKRENNKLRNDLTLLQNKVLNMEIVKCDKSIEINGAFEGADNDDVIKKKALKVLKYVIPDFSDNLVEDLKAIKPKDRAPLASLTLKSRAVVQDVLRGRREKGDINTTTCGIDQRAKRVFINEVLSKSTYQLLKEAKQLRQRGFKYVWSRNNLVFIKKDDGDQAIRMKDSAHVKAILQNENTND